MQSKAKTHQLKKNPLQCLLTKGHAKFSSYNLMAEKKINLERDEKLNSFQIFYFGKPNYYFLCLREYQSPWSKNTIWLDQAYILFCFSPSKQFHYLVQYCTKLVFLKYFLPYSINKIQLVRDIPRHGCPQHYVYCSSKLQPVQQSNNRNENYTVFGGRDVSTLCRPNTSTNLRHCLQV